MSDCEKKLEKGGYHPSPRQQREYNRRDFLKLTSLAAAGAFGASALPGSRFCLPAMGSVPAERIIRVHSGTVQDWDFSSPEFWLSVRKSVMDDMFARGLCALTDRSNVLDAWSDLLPGYQPGQSIAIKLNMNSYDENANQTCEMATVIIDSLAEFGVPLDRISIFDVVRRWPAYWRDRWSSPVALINQDEVIWDDNATVYFPAIDTYHRFPTILSEADHLINVCLQKGHKSYVTGSMKNHFGSQEDPSDLHVQRHTNICTLAAAPMIQAKTRLIVTEGIFMTWHKEGGAFEETVNTSLFPVGASGHSSPNYLLLGTNMLAVDSVLGDIQNAERDARGEPTWSNPFLDQAAQEPYNLGPREIGTLVPNSSGWSELDLKYDTLDYQSFTLRPVARMDIDMMQSKLRKGEIHWSQLRHLVERYEQRL